MAYSKSKRTFKKKALSSKKTGNYQTHVPRVAFNNNKYVVQKLVTLSTDASGYLYFNTRCNDLTGFTDITSLAALYDTYKVTYISIQYIPNYSVKNYDATNNACFKLFVMSYDPDSYTPIVTFDEGLSTKYNKWLDLKSHWKYSTSIVTQTSGQTNTGGLGVNYRPGLGMMLDFAQMPYYDRGLISGYSEGNPVSLYTGNVIIKAFITCADRR